MYNIKNCVKRAEFYASRTSGLKPSCCVCFACNHVQITKSTERRMAGSVIPQGRRRRGYLNIFMIGRGGSQAWVVWLPYICLLFLSFSNVYHSACNFDMFFLVMGFNSLVDEIQFMLISSMEKDRHGLMSHRGRRWLNNNNNNIWIRFISHDKGHVHLLKVSPCEYFSFPQVCLRKPLYSHLNFVVFWAWSWCCCYCVDRPRTDSRNLVGDNNTDPELNSLMEVSSRTHLCSFQIWLHT